MAEPIIGTYDLVQLRFGELFLKGRNRSHFVRRLADNLHASLKAAVGRAAFKVHVQHGRFLVELHDPTVIDQVMDICVDTPGFATVQPVRRCEPTLEAVTATALKLVAETWIDFEGTFAVRCRRSYKRHPLTSTQIERAVGGLVGEQVQLEVDLKNADHHVWIELAEEHAYVWTVDRRGAGGLPVSSSGKALLLLSGGIDSPVAGYLAQKRGCMLEAVYFHSPPFISENARDKVEQIAAKLAPRQSWLNLNVVRFTEIQQAIHEKCHARYTVLLYRRFMYRIAHRIAAQRKCMALATGENLAQVASQTLANLNLVDHLGELLTLRPVLTYDKREIMDLARRIGTYDLSIMPFDDCCTLFLPDNPATRAREDQLVYEEAKLDVDALVAQAIENTERVRLDGLSDED
jgi:thiamine biosynthesis protein ThiI